jgi:hypothetical protein
VRFCGNDNGRIAGQQGRANKPTNTVEEKVVVFIKLHAVPVQETLVPPGSDIQS